MHAARELVIEGLEVLRGHEQSSGRDLEHASHSRVAQPIGKALDAAPARAADRGAQVEDAGAHAQLEHLEGAHGRHEVVRLVLLRLKV